MKESDIRPREIPSPKDSVFLANMRSHQKVFHRLEEFGKMLREPGTNFPEGVEEEISPEELQEPCNEEGSMDTASTTKWGTASNADMWVPTTTW